MVSTSTLLVNDSTTLYSYSTQTGAITAIGNFGTNIRDVAGLSNGQLFGVSAGINNPDPPYLQSINPVTGVATRVAALVGASGSFGSGVNALAADSTGQLYAASGLDRDIYKINSTTGQLTLFAKASADSSGDLLVFNNKLWMSLDEGRRIESFDLATGARVGSFTHGIQALTGLALGPAGEVYGFSFFNAYVFNLEAGTFTTAATFPARVDLRGATLLTANQPGDLTGTEQADVLVASGAVGVHISGLGGNDSLTGSIGNDVLIGGTGNDVMNGGAGRDTAVFSQGRAQYTIAKSGAEFTVGSAAEGSDRVSNVERLKFADQSVALDAGVGQSAGNTMLLLGAVLGRELTASKKPLIGTVIDLFDQGFTLPQLSGALMRLPIWGLLANGGNETASNEQIATYLLTVVGRTTPSADLVAYATNALNTEIDAAQGGLLAALAISSANQLQVDLVGLGASGIDFIG